MKKYRVAFYYEPKRKRIIFDKKLAKLRDLAEEVKIPRDVYEDFQHRLIKKYATETWRNPKFLKQTILLDSDIERKHEGFFHLGVYFALEKKFPKLSGIEIKDYGCKFVSS